MSESGACALICACFPGRSSLFGLNMHNAVSTVAAPGFVFIYIRKSSGVPLEVLSRRADPSSRCQEMNRGVQVDQEPRSTKRENNGC